MTRLDKHISELLYDHECVIVPQLGGFLTSYAPARIHTSRHSLTPPTKKIAFNVFLRHNDGLLANYIVHAESITYPEALREIEDYVERCNHVLSEGKKFVIERVGILTRDQETNLQFEPFKNVNYLKDSFGLAPVQFMPLAHRDFEQEVEQQLRDFISLRPSKPQPRQPLVRKKTRLNKINVLLLSGSILWLCLNLYIVAPDNVNFASLNPFAVSVNEQPAPPSAPVVTRSEVYTQPNVAKTETVYVKSESAQPVAAESPSAVSLSDAKSFFLVAGAFNSDENAHRLEAELKSSGFEKVSVIETRDGLKLVCYNSFATHDEAFAELNRVKAQHKDGWIFQR